MPTRLTTNEQRRLAWSRFNTIIPPFAGVTLQECRDRIALTPYYWCREFVALGKYEADKVGPQSGERLHPLFAAIMGGKKIRVVTTWRRYEDGRDEALNIHYLDPEATEADARLAFDQASRFLAMSREELEKLTACFKASPDEIAYAESRPSEEKPGRSKSIDERDLYQARLKV